MISKGQALTGTIGLTLTTWRGWYFLEVLASTFTVSIGSLLMFVIKHFIYHCVSNGFGKYFHDLGMCMFVVE